MKTEIITGRLINSDQHSFVEGTDGERYFEDELIWDGYLKHWSGQEICARRLLQKDYQQHQSIIIMWLKEKPSNEPFVDLYYNERLVKYWASTFGHNAINVNGEIFNFSHLINENEVISLEEYFYRPALGEFAPSPNSGMFEILPDGTAYYDKFGRNFMRTIHVTRIIGIDIVRLSEIFHRQLEIIHNAPVNPKKPEKYKDFNFFNRSCSTIIRDGLIEYGFSGIRGFLPRDMFISATHAILKASRNDGIAVKRFIMPQLLVAEAAPSALTPLFNLRNRIYLRNFPALEPSQ